MQCNGLMFTQGLAACDTSHPRVVTVTTRGSVPARSYRVAAGIIGTGGGAGPCDNTHFCLMVIYDQTNPAINASAPIYFAASPALANIEIGTLQYDAWTAPVTVTSSMTVTSLSTHDLVSATVSITSGLVSPEDVLSFTDQNGISGSYEASVGVLRLTGTARVSIYETALRSVTYTDSNGAGATSGDRVVSFQGDDGLANNNTTNVVSRTVQVVANTAPVVNNVSVFTDKNTAIDINALASASDPDGDTLTVTKLNTTGTLGEVSINGNGTILYNPNGKFSSLTQGQTATDTFGFTVSDPYGNSASATVTVTITGVQ